MSREIYHCKRRYGAGMCDCCGAELGADAGPFCDYCDANCAGLIHRARCRKCRQPGTQVDMRGESYCDGCYRRPVCGCGQPAVGLTDMGIACCRACLDARRKSIARQQAEYDELHPPSGDWAGRRWGDDGYRGKD